MVHETYFFRELEQLRRARSTASCPELLRTRSDAAHLVARHAPPARSRYTLAMLLAERRAARSGRARRHRTSARKRSPVRAAASTAVAPCARSPSARVRAISSRRRQDACAYEDELRRRIAWRRVNLVDPAAVAALGPLRRRSSAATCSSTLPTSTVRAGRREPRRRARPATAGCWSAPRSLSSASARSSSATSAARHSSIARLANEPRAHPRPGGRRFGLRAQSGARGPLGRPRHRGGGHRPGRSRRAGEDRRAQSRRGDARSAHAATSTASACSMRSPARARPRVVVVSTSDEQSSIGPGGAPGRRHRARPQAHRARHRSPLRALQRARTEGRDRRPRHAASHAAPRRRTGRRSAATIATPRWNPGHRRFDGRAAGADPPARRAAR